jgi:hypothetical protein
VSSSTLSSDVSRGVAYQSSLTLGLLGLPLAEQLHSRVHQIFGSEEPLGYGHQVSDGGEPTFRYTVLRYQLLASGEYETRPYGLRFGAAASIGYATEANAELALRFGRRKQTTRINLASGSFPAIAVVRARRPPRTLSCFNF